MRIAKTLAIILVMALSLGLVAIAVYTAYVARLWLQAMQS